MGIYNCASTLQEALDSLFAQTFQDFEIILCEDGSSDNTYDIALANQQQHPDRIVLLRNEHNMGLNQTLNNCIAVARGDYFARMDGDDISLPERFETEVKFLDEHPQYAIVSTPMIYFDENGEFRRVRGGGEPKIKDLVKKTPHCHAPCMVRREAYLKVGGYTVSPKLLRVEDYHLWYKMYLAGFRGYNLGEPLYAMRDDRNATARRKMKFRINGCRVKYMICRDFHLPLTAYIHILRPIAVGLLPTPIYNRLHRKK